MPVHRCAVSLLRRLIDNFFGRALFYMLAFVQFVSFAALKIQGSTTAWVVIAIVFTVEVHHSFLLPPHATAALTNSAQVLVLGYLQRAKRYSAPTGSGLTLGDAQTVFCSGNPTHATVTLLQKPQPAREAPQHIPQVQVVPRFADPNHAAELFPLCPGSKGVEVVVVGDMLALSTEVRSSPGQYRVSNVVVGTQRRGSSARAQRRSVFRESQTADVLGHQPRPAERTAGGAVTEAGPAAAGPTLRSLSANDLVELTGVAL